MILTHTRRRQVALLLIALLVLIADQLSKQLVLRSLSLGQSWYPIPLLRGLLSITYVTNTGAAFGLFPEQGLIFTAVAIVVAAGIVVYYRYLPVSRWPVRVSLGLQLGGALGNLVDRLRYGHVVDFVDLKVWPIFNVADSAIVLGVAILAWYLLRSHEKEMAAQRERRELKVWGDVGGEGGIQGHEGD